MGTIALWSFTSASERAMSQKIRTLSALACGCSPTHESSVSVTPRCTPYVFFVATKISFFRLWCQACGCWSRRTSVFYETWLQQCAAVGFLFWRARNEAKRKLLSALDSKRWSKTQTKREIDKLQKKNSIGYSSSTHEVRLFYRSAASYDFSFGLCLQMNVNDSTAS